MIGDLRRCTGAPCGIGGIASKDNVGSELLFDHAEFPSQKKDFTAKCGMNAKRGSERSFNRLNNGGLRDQLPVSTFAF